MECNNVLLLLAHKCQIRELSKRLTTRASFFNLNLNQRYLSNGKYQLRISFLTTENLATWETRFSNLPRLLVRANTHNRWSLVQRCSTRSSPWLSQKPSTTSSQSLPKTNPVEQGLSNQTPQDLINSLQGRGSINHTNSAFVAPFTVQVNFESR